MHLNQKLKILTYMMGNLLKKRKIRISSFLDFLTWLLIGQIRLFLTKTEKNIKHSDLHKTGLDWPSSTATPSRSYIWNSYNKVGDCWLYIIECRSSKFITWSGHEDGNILHCLDFNFNFLQGNVGFSPECIHKILLLLCP